MYLTVLNPPNMVLDHGLTGSNSPIIAIVPKKLAMLSWHSFSFVPWKAKLCLIRNLTAETILIKTYLQRPLSFATSHCKLSSIVWFLLNLSLSSFQVFMFQLFSCWSSLRLICFQSFNPSFASKLMFSLDLNNLQQKQKNFVHLFRVNQPFSINHHLSA
jgi:hypothetical protein